MLYAAKVPDAVIMLMCRWMCEASLHIYRRLGTAEHESNFRRAMTANVDAIQSANVSTVVGDQNFAQLLNDLNNTHDRASFVDSYAAALRGDAAAAAPAAAAAAAAAPIAAPRPPPSAPHASPALVHRNPAPIDPANAIGRTVCVAARRWPQYRCDENSGAGWQAIIIQCTRCTALVSFTHARTGRAANN